MGWRGTVREREEDKRAPRGREGEDDERECRSLTLSAREWIRTKAQLGSVFTVPFFRKKTPIIYYRCCFLINWHL